MIGSREKHCHSNWPLAKVYMEHDEGGGPRGPADHEVPKTRVGSPSAIPVGGGRKEKVSRWDRWRKNSTIRNAVLAVLVIILLFLIWGLWNDYFKYGSGSNTSTKVAKTDSALAAAPLPDLTPYVFNTPLCREDALELKVYGVGSKKIPIPHGLDLMLVARAEQRYQVITNKGDTVNCGGEVCGTFKSRADTAFARRMPGDTATAPMVLYFFLAPNKGR